MFICNNYVYVFFSNSQSQKYSQPQRHWHSYQASYLTLGFQSVRYLSPPPNPRGSKTRLANLLRGQSARSMGLIPKADVPITPPIPFDFQSWEQSLHYLLITHGYFRGMISFYDRSYQDLDNFGDVGIERECYHFRSYQSKGKREKIKRFHVQLTQVLAEAV